ncbi:hypothetical protein LSH36_168g01014 [Paralvinella palmiformis]|uniref:Uncharacterized protein n=1 Tax=Paralvinella palmiformis TaxID=53620 RepID=A0AAD9JT52_9ANNE|nr:hypothetical protein LSH36_168g01014 [Paralvinella palmiformis]
MEDAFLDLASRLTTDGRREKVYTCGLGCNTHIELIENILRCQIINIFERDCFVDGFQFLTKHFPLTDITYPQSEEIRQYADKMANSLAQEHLMLATKFKETCHGRMWQSSKKLLSDGEGTASNDDSNGTENDLNKVEEDGSYTFLNLVPASGKTIDALCSLITGTKKFEDIVTLAGNGCLHNISTIGSKMKLDTDDVYGALSHGTLVFDLGRAVGKEVGHFRREDLCLGIISMVIQMLVSSFHDWALITNIRQVFFSGGLYKSELIRDMIGKYFAYKSKMNPIGKETRHYFLKHGMYIGVIGALMKTLNSPTSIN